MSVDLKEHGYYKEKGVVEKVVSRYLAQVAMLKSGDVLQVTTHPFLHFQSGRMPYSTHRLFCVDDSARMIHRAQGFLSVFVLPILRWLAGNARRKRRLS